MSPTAMEVVSDAPTAPPGARAADLNWAAIHALVQEIPKTFRDPSFSNSGHQISRVVTASDPARELEQVKAWQTSLEDIVGQLVGTHHGSLSRSIKNYAEIVQLFEVNRANVDTTRALLNEGRARLVSDAGRDEKVRETWRRTLVGREVARKFADLERLMRVPETVRACVAAGDFETAVARVKEADADLSAPAMRDVQTALADARRERAATEEFVRARLVREIGHVVFCCDAPCRRDAAFGNPARPARSRVGGNEDTEEDTNGSLFAARATPSVPFAAGDAATRRETVSRLIGCAARLGEPGFARALEGLRRVVPGEIWTLIAEQIAHGAERADDLEAAARRAKAEGEWRRDADDDDDDDDDDVFADGAETDDVSRAPPHSVAAMEVLAAHVCALACAVLGNLRALDAELANRSAELRDGGGKEEKSETSFAARGCETLRAALPLALGGLGRAPRLCEGLEGFVPGGNARARDAGSRAWWHVSREARKETEDVSGEKPGRDARAAATRARLFAFWAKGRTSAEREDARDGDEHFARAAAAAARAARARLCGSGASMRIFELECVKETLRVLELDEARA